MQSLGLDFCTECSRPMMDAGDELACPGCGAVKEKTVLEARRGPVSPRAVLGPQLGSFMGTSWTTRAERTAKGISGSNSSYRYMKTVSDFTGRDGGSESACIKLMVRVSENLHLPAFVEVQAASIARRIFTEGKATRRLNIAEVSAYSLVAACKLNGVMSVSIREIIEAYGSLGRKVTSSAMIRLSLESPVRTYANGPRDYITRVLGRLSLNERLSARLSRAGVIPTTYFNQLRQVAKLLLDSTDKVAMEGKRPCALAAAAVYSAEVLASGWEGRGRRVTQRDLARCGDTSEYTVREQCAGVFRPAVKSLARGERPTPLPEISR
jgi:transcription initiation factor TFIIIB Brf1 subunit/transcription initiation factor TFIIB